MFIRTPNRSKWRTCGNAKSELWQPSLVLGVHRRVSGSDVAGGFWEGFQPPGRRPHGRGRVGSERRRACVQHTVRRSSAADHNKYAQGSGSLAPGAMQADR